MLFLQAINKFFHQGTPNENLVLKNLDLHLAKGDYVTIIGGNGSGKSTLLNCISGFYKVDGGQIHLETQDITKMAEYKRAKFLGRVFQDPLMGTSAQMTIEENLALAYRRGKRAGLAWGITKTERGLFKDLLRPLQLGLEGRLTTQVGLLSGGQRQALTLLMATLAKPKVLLLDEHTAALDPKTATTVLQLTDSLIKQNELTALMVTHNLRDAISYGNRLIMMDDGEIILDLSGKEKENLTVEMLLEQFRKAGGKIFEQELALLA